MGVPSRVASIFVTRTSTSSMGLSTPPASIATQNNISTTTALRDSAGLPAINRMNPSAADASTVR